jgi:hypothetical protein
VFNGIKIHLSHRFILNPNDPIVVSDDEEEKETNQNTFREIDLYSELERITYFGVLVAKCDVRVLTMRTTAMVNTFGDLIKKQVLHLLLLIVTILKYLTTVCHLDGYIQIHNRKL